jgi:hypothetical protein
MQNPRGKIGSKKRKIEDYPSRFRIKGKRADYLIRCSPESSNWMAGPQDSKPTLS